MASIHAEVPNDVDIEVSHEIIDRIGRDAAKAPGIFLVIHMDPVETGDEHCAGGEHQVEQILDAVDHACPSMISRWWTAKEQINLIFDMVVPFEYSTQKQNELKMILLNGCFRWQIKRYQCVITIERSYVASAKG